MARVRFCPKTDRFSVRDFFRDDSRRSTERDVRLGKEGLRHRGRSRYSVQTRCKVVPYPKILDSVFIDR